MELIEGLEGLEGLEKENRPNTRAKESCCNQLLRRKKLEYDETVGRCCMGILLGFEGKEGDESAKNDQILEIRDVVNLSAVTIIIQKML